MLLLKPLLRSLSSARSRRSTVPCCADALCACEQTFDSHRDSRLPKHRCLLQVTAYQATDA